MCNAKASWRSCFRGERLVDFFRSGIDFWPWQYVVVVYVSAIEVSYMLPKTCVLVAKFCMAQYHSRCQDTGVCLVAMGICVVVSFFWSMPDAASAQYTCNEDRPGIVISESRAKQNVKSRDDSIPSCVVPWNPAINQYRPVVSRGCWITPE